MEINEELQHMITPYNNLYGKRNDNSKPYYMIAEFIDNSLSSWVENKMESDLRIDVYHNYKDKILRVSDNAFGMNRQQLGDSIQLYNEKDGNVLSMFGVGMKNASFWFGEDLYISTKQRGGAGYKTDIMLSDKINTEEIKKQISWKITQDNEIQNPGTIVTIRNMYPDKLMSNPKTINDVLQILSLKYKRYLAKNVRIDFTIDRFGEVQSYSFGTGDNGRRTGYSWRVEFPDL
jgi:HSP90 family molecular chaperone